MEDLKKLAIKLGTDGPVKTLGAQRVVKILFNGSYIVQSTQAQFVWEHPFYPQFYIPRKELEANAKGNDKDSNNHNLSITKGEEIKTKDGKHVADLWTLHVGSRSTNKVLAFGSDLAGPAAALNDLVKIDFASVDQWFEEDTPIRVHPKDPFKRVDILHSLRPLRISLHGQVLAETRTSLHLHETGLPCRYYIPLTAVDPTILRPSSTRTQCPYKGEAEYYSIEVGGQTYEDLVWYYVRPTIECAAIMGMVCFYNEKVDIELDGVKLQRPDTHFGRSKPSENKKPSAF